YNILVSPNWEIFKKIQHVTQKKYKKPNSTPLRPSLHSLKQRVSLTVKNILIFILKSLLPL
ncbi:TPA: hypothetical protein ACKPC6_003018, partial [Listeria monocytogenes]